MIREYHSTVKEMTNFLSTPASTIIVLTKNHFLSKVTVTLGVTAKIH